MLRRRALGVPRAAVGTLVDRRVATGVERVRVVTRGEVEVAVVVELHRPTRVAALVALRRDVEDRRRRVELQRVARHREARDAVDGLRAGRRVVEVDPVVRGEVGVERDAEQAELLARVDRDRARGQHAAVLLDDAHGAVAVDVEHPTVVGDGELHRVGGVLVEGHLLEAGRQGRLAVRVHDAGSGLDAAEDVARGRPGRRRTPRCDPCRCTSCGRRRSPGTRRSGARCPSSRCPGCRWSRPATPARGAWCGGWPPGWSGSCTTRRCAASGAGCRRWRGARGPRP